MKFKNIFSLFLICVMLLTAASCAKPDIQDTQSVPKPREITVSDSDGNEVTTSGTNARIAAIGCEAVSLLIALGAEDLLCGIDSGSRSAELITKAYPAISDVAEVTDTQGTVLTDSIVAQSPGLVVMTGEFSQYADALKEAGLSVAIVRFETVSEIKSSAELIGKLSNAESKAAELSGFYDSALTRIKVMTATETRASVTLYDDDAVLRELISYLNCDIVKSGKYVIAKSADAPDGAIIAPSKLEHWDEPSISLVLGLYWYAHSIFPQIMSAQEVTQKAIDFYAKFYGITVTAADLGIESGETAD